MSVDRYVIFVLLVIYQKVDKLIEMDALEKYIN